MSGHSRWAQIKRQKGTTDAKRGMLYTKISKMISAAVRQGGKDPSMNLRLRLLIDKARSANMPNATIERAIKRGAGELSEGLIEEVTYEGFGPGGVALVIAAVTDNKNRTTSEIRHLLARYGGNLGTANSVLWMFVSRGKLEIPAPDLSEERQLALIDAGAEDVVSVEGGWLVYTKPEEVEKIKEAADALGLAVSNPEVEFVPKKETLVPVASDRPLVTLINGLEELEDVTNVTTNAA